MCVCVLSQSVVCRSRAFRFVIQATLRGNPITLGRRFFEDIIRCDQIYLCGVSFCGSIDRTRWSIGKRFRSGVFINDELYVRLLFFITTWTDFGSEGNLRNNRPLCFIILPMEMGQSVSNLLPNKYLDGTTEADRRSKT